MRTLLIMLAVLCCFAAPAFAEAKTVAVFVALCDNKSQGIVPVPEALGNGEDPEKNLYWGSGEGFKTVFDKGWKLVNKVDAAEGDVLRQRTYETKDGTVKVEAKAYRGKAIRKCIEDFEAALRAGKHDLVIFVGHNGLIDFELPVVKKEGAAAKQVDAMVLCCRSEAYFGERIKAAGARPMLLTTQLMYPGSFLADAAIRQWGKRAAAAEIREAAGKAYAANQKISEKAGLGVFSKLP